MDFSETTTPNEWGDFDMSLGDWGFDAQAGHEVTVSDGSTVKTTTVTELVVTEVDVGADTVSGTAAPDSEVYVDIFDEDGFSRIVNADEWGGWTADFNSEGPGDPGYDIVLGTNGSASQQDEDGDGTWDNWNVPNPQFRIDPHDDQVWGHEWPADTELTVEIDDPGNGPGVDFSETTTPNEWGDFDMSLGDWGFDAQAGHEVTVSDGSTVKTTTVTELVVTEVDVGADTVSGTAAPDSDVMVDVYPPDEEGTWREATADSEGNWTADFSVEGDGDGQYVCGIGLGTNGSASQQDEDGDGTWDNWHVSNPRVNVSPHDPEHMWGEDWLPNATVDITIDDPVTPGDDFTDTVPTSPEGTFETHDFTLDIEAGSLVTVTDGESTKEHWVTALDDATADADTDTVSGTAEPYSDVLVELWIIEDDANPARWVTADGNGDWIADFSSAVGPGLQDQAWNIDEGVAGWARQFDSDDDSTQQDFRVPVTWIAGTVTDELGAWALEGVDVSLYAWDGGDWLEAGWDTTDVNGYYSFMDLEEDDYRVGFAETHTWFVAEFYDGQATVGAAADVHVAEDSYRHDVDAALERTDLTPPALGDNAQATYDYLPVSIEITATDDFPGVDIIRYQLDGGPTQTVESDSAIVAVSTTGDHSLTYWGTDLLGNTSDPTIVDFTISPPAEESERLSNRTRFSTAVAIAKEAFPGWENVQHVIVASGDDRAAADPLAASGLCGVYDAPLLLVSARQTPGEVKTAMQQIVAENGPVTLHVVGGPVSVPDARVNEIKAAVGASNVTVERILATGGRYDLAAAIAERMRQVTGEKPDVVLIANGADPSKFFDALALSPIAANKHYPILLVSATKVPPATQSELAKLDPDRVIIGGGPNTVSNTVKSKLGAERWDGRTRYTTALSIANKAMAEGWLGCGCTGIAAKLPDALTGGSMVGRMGGVLVLTDGASLTAETRTWLETHASTIMNCYAFGGPNSISDKVKLQIDNCLD